MKSILSASIMRALLLILFLFLIQSAFGQAKFFRVYSGNDEDGANGVVQLEDSSYIVTGSSSSFDGTASQAFLLKLDSLGNYVWSLDYGGSEAEEGRRVLYVPGSFFYIAGFTNSIGNGAYDFYLAKTDLNGQLLWERAYGDYGWDRVHDAATTSDGGVIMVGESASTVLNDLDMYMVRTDLNGDTLWTKQIGEYGDDLLESVVQLNDSIYYAFGSTFVTDSLLNKAYVMCFHENGTVLWEDTLGTDGNYYIHGACVDTVANELLAVGHVEGPSHQSIDYLFIRMQLDGNVIDISNGNAAGIQEYRLVTTYGLASKRYIGWNYFDQWSAGTGNAAAISKHDGVMGWEQTGVVVNFALPDEINELIPTSDGGAIGVGRTHEQYVDGPSRVYVAKIGPNDDYPQEWTITPFVIEELVELYHLTESEFPLSIFPNPSTGILHVEAQVSEPVYMEVLDLLGRVVRSKKLTLPSTISLLELENGMYHLNFRTKSSSTSKRLTICR